MADEETNQPAPAEPEAPAETPAAPAAEAAEAPVAAEATAPAAEATEAPAAEASAPAAEATEAPAAEANAPAAEETKAKAGKTAKKKAAAAAAATPKAEAGPAPTAAELLDPDLLDQPKIIKAKGNKNVTSGIAHVLATFNNTLVSITDFSGNVLGWSSAGKVGFKGSRKSTAYAAQMVAQDASRQAMGHGLKEVEVRVKGPGAGRESAVRALQAVGLEISLIKDVTPVPHNGCRPPKQRRV